MTVDEVVGWHHRLNEHEFEQIPGDSKGQRSLACCSLLGRRVRHSRTSTIEVSLIGSILK